jgi:hypothetical protein
LRARHLTNAAQRSYSARAALSEGLAFELGNRFGHSRILSAAREIKKGR